MMDDRLRCRECGRIATGPLLFEEFCAVTCYRASIKRQVDAQVAKAHQAAMLLHAAKEAARRREATCAHCKRLFTQTPGKHKKYCCFPCSHSAASEASEAKAVAKITPESVIERTAIVRAFKMQQGEAESGRPKVFPFAEYASL